MELGAAHQGSVRESGVHAAMKSKTRIHVLSAQRGYEEWLLHYSEEPPWSVTVDSPRGESYSDTAQDLFYALQKVRRRLEVKNVTVCCNGARPNARSSPMIAAGGSSIIYLVPRGRPATPRDLVPLFSPAPADAVVSVDQQDEIWESLISSSGFLAKINPIRLVKALEMALKGPRYWAPHIDPDGMTTWKPVRPGAMRE